VKRAKRSLHQARHREETSLDLYAGDDNILFPFLELGGVGGVCVHTHVVGPRVKEMIRLHKAGDHVEARRIDEELEAAYDLLKVETNPIAIKAALNLLGHEVGGLRLPLVEATEDQLALVRSCLERLGGRSRLTIARDQAPARLANAWSRRIIRPGGLVVGKEHDQTRVTAAVVTTRASRPGATMSTASIRAAGHLVPRRPRGPSTPSCSRTRTRIRGRHAVPPARGRRS
jgi:hypothetical protein